MKTKDEVAQEIAVIVANAEAKRQKLNLQIKQMLQEHDMLDTDGYPTEHLLWIVENWPYQDDDTFLDFLNPFWHQAWWGWSKKVEDHPYRANRQVLKYHISTAGWSGNEALIRAFQKNEMLWYVLWEQSRRGGHYIFELDLTRNEVEEQKDEK